MNPRIETLIDKKLVGISIEMSFSKDKTFELWRAFMPRLKEVNNKIGSDLYSIEVYDSQFFNNFDLNHGFVKWAAIEVTDFNGIPDGLETFELSGGLYAVFTHHSPASNATETYQFVFEKWLPNSIYTLDDRPHFAVMGEKYKHEELTSEEEIWIPIR
jgi:AraC family transcriptional regulator